ncbi:MAG: hypothetical protein ACI9OJ_002742 [Myxococcota bacterium]|jgi:hypothetical protein
MGVTGSFLVLLRPITTAKNLKWSVSPQTDPPLSSRVSSAQTQPAGLRLSSKNARHPSSSARSDGASIHRVTGLSNVSPSGPKSYTLDTTESPPTFVVAGETVSVVSAARAPAGTVSVAVPSAD